MPNLLVQTAFIGDLLLAVPLMKKIKELHPGELHLVCRKGTGSLMKAMGLVDHFYEMDKSNPKTLNEIQKQLKNIEFENIFCPHQSFRSALFVRGLKAENKYGFFKWWSFFSFTETRERPMFLPDALRQMSLLTLSDSNFKKQFEDVVMDTQFHNVELKDNIFEWPRHLIPKWASADISSRIKKIEGVDEQFTRLKPIIFIAPGSVWRTKKWTTEGFVKVAKYYKDKGYNIILVGAPSDIDTCDEIEDQVEGIINMAGKTDMLQMLHTLSHGKVLISNDSGAQHFASLVNLPTVSVFGATTLSLGYRPWNERSAIIQKDLKCRPCGKHGSNECPIGTHECMTEINPDHVIQATNQFLYQ